MGGGRYLYRIELFKSGEKVPRMSFLQCGVGDGSMARRLRTGGWLRSKT